MNRPTWGREHQIAGLPRIPLAFDDAESLAGEVVVHRRADVAMRAINDIFGRMVMGGKEVARGSVGVSSAGVVEQVQAAAEVCFAQSRQFVHSCCTRFHGKYQGWCLTTSGPDPFS